MAGEREARFSQTKGPDYMRPVRTLTGTTQTGLIKFTWTRSESMKWFHETGTRLQIGINVYMKHAGSSYFPFVVCLIAPFIVKYSTANKNTTESAESEEKRENYSVSSPHKHSTSKRKDHQKQEEMVDCSRKDWLLVVRREKDIALIQTILQIKVCWYVSWSLIDNTHFIEQ